LDFAMSGTEFEEQTESTAEAAEANLPCMALVPMVQSAHWTQTPSMPRKPAPCGERPRPSRRRPIDP
jgi:hypothetical protein